MKLEPNRLENSKTLLGVFNVDYLSALVHPRFRVNAVRHLCFARVFVKIELRRLESIMSSSFAGTRMGMSSFRIWHFRLLRSLDLLNKILVQILQSRPSW